MFANCTAGYMNLAFPDVCMTPIPGAPPIPIPYPNNANGCHAQPMSTVLKVMIGGKPAHNVKTSIMMSTGDNPGIQGGVKSRKFIGPSKHSKGSSAVFAGGKPVTRLADPTKQNGGNANTFGVTIKPAQAKVLVTK